uniref:Uncharacterized protein n=1 Tax=Shewanella putrefaciens (strain 200) TaxID=399804 RepID=E6XKC0_SHEP2
MGQHRKDRTTEEWTAYGHLLLQIIGKRHKLYKEIEPLINKLNENKLNINECQITESLNSHKYELKDHWRKWTQKIKQIPKDAGRTKFYIKKSTFENILNFICLSPELKLKKGLSDEAVFDILLIHLNSYGINNTKEMYDLIEKLEKYKPDTIERNSSKDLFEQEKPKHNDYEVRKLKEAIKDIHKEFEPKKNKETKSEIETLINIKWIIYDAIKTKHYQGENNTIINSILEELNKNKITNLRELQNIREIVGNKLKDENELLINENDKLHQDVMELELKLLDIDLK